MRDGLCGLKGIKDDSYGLSDFVRLLCVLFAIDWLPGLALSVMWLIFVEVLVAHKYFIAFHFLNNIIIDKTREADHCLLIVCCCESSRVLIPRRVVSVVCCCAWQCCS